MVVINYAWNPVFDCITKETDDAGATIAKYTQEPKLYGGLISQRRSGVSSFYHYDAIGTTRALTNDSQAVTDTAVHTAFGEKVFSVGTTANEFEFGGFFGYLSLSSVANTNARRRDLKPALIRWLSLEPGEGAHAGSSFGYCINRPAYFIDPTGLVAAFPRLPITLPGPVPKPGKGGPGGTLFPGTPTQNCLGESIGKPELINWPHLPFPCSEKDFEDAQAFVPTGCEPTPCPGSISQTYCTPTEIELIIMIYTWPVAVPMPGGNPPIEIVGACDFHAVARDCLFACPWHSKKDKRECVAKITDPITSCHDAYSHTKNKSTTIAKHCYCCDQSKMKTKPIGGGITEIEGA